MKLLKKLFTSYKATLILMLAYIILMIIGTIIEKYEGTNFAKMMIYYSPLFLLIQLLLIGNIIGITLRQPKLLKRPPYLSLHVSFIIILLGAAVTHFFSTEGLMHLREGETSNIVFDRQSGSTIVQLPFNVQLKKFRLLRYPGSNSPSSYESDLCIIFPNQEKQDVRIFMNNVLDMQGYRFFQASYDPDEKGTILSVSNDVYGRRITYTGYFILAIALLLNLFYPSSHFRKLLQQLTPKVTICLLLTTTALQSKAQIHIPTSHLKKAEQLATLNPSGRIVPLQTLSEEIVRKINKNNKIDGFTPTEFILSVITNPQAWVQKPIILNDNIDFAHKYHLPTPNMSYRDAFNSNGNYKFTSLVEHAYRKQPSSRNATDKALLKMDERVNLMHMLFNYQLIRIFPIPNDTIKHNWVAPGDKLTDFSSTDSLRLTSTFRNYLNAARIGYTTGVWKRATQSLDTITSIQQEWATKGLINTKKIQAEIHYNTLNILHYVKRLYLQIGCLLLLITLYTISSTKTHKNIRRLWHILYAILIFNMGAHLYNIILRWYISGFAPWSNSYETMICLSWTIALVGIIFTRKNIIVPSLSFILSGIVLFVAGLNWMDPQITPLVPVLKSPWLMFHVAVLILGYGFFGISCMIGAASILLNPILHKNNKNTTNNFMNISTINEICMILGLTFSIIGIMLGAVWANESWGRYWSWDPKETWALITAVIYTAILHWRWFYKKKTDTTFNLLALWAFLAVLMTYFGVNYFLAGMHSYGDSDILARIPLIGYIAFATFFLLPTIVSFTQKNK